ncbi:YjjG family noncanonical pyrimidine nucleotidase [Planococcus lenghuensis]|uniref:Noncanonical pyrimidine nucleotidase, YjjG family n=1 Tax=Planococcus lenghuensis TaxID=2213202 RepID=A0A1Q2KWD0_9BACL|nr:YjjG family noncanonical pyrimidine nucleotidase [Planococcus lenghuensis]AQQ52453.1 noncanonical pyrimidine nucleotidase, YjjG family [Planococcus lenghuensis]
MKSYKTLLFDLDDTLLDFKAAEQEALKSLFSAQGMSLTDKVAARYRLLNKDLWQSFEEGKITKEEVIHTRFARLFAEYEKEVDGREMDDDYRKHLERGVQFVAGARELVSSLHGRFSLYIVTNGIARTQLKRLHDSGLYPLFDGIFISEELKAQKPMNAFFKAVFAEIPSFTPAGTLIIGDSFNADIRGGQAAGIDTCWFNRHNLPRPGDIQPTYEVRELQELQRLLQDKPGKQN